MPKTVRNNESNRRKRIAAVDQAMTRRGRKAGKSAQEAPRPGAPPLGRAPRPGAPPLGQASRPGAPTMPSTRRGEPPVRPPEAPTGVGMQPAPISQTPVAMRAPQSQVTVPLPEQQNAPPFMPPQAPAPPIMPPQAPPMGAIVPMPGGVPPEGMAQQVGAVAPAQMPMAAQAPMAQATVPAPMPGAPGMGALPPPGAPGMGAIAPMQGAPPMPGAPGMMAQQALDPRLIHRRNLLRLMKMNPAVQQLMPWYRQSTIPMAALQNMPYEY